MNVLELFGKVRIFIFDMDGVLTDGTLQVLDDGLFARRMNIKDGYALQLAVKKEYPVIVVSGSNSPEVSSRLAKLGIAEVYMQITDKRSFLTDYFTARSMNWSSVLYMGDDLPDLSSMVEALIPCCPQDASHDIKKISRYISPFKGGNGCVRDVIEKVLLLNGDWDADLKIAAK